MSAASGDSEAGPDAARGSAATMSSQARRADDPPTSARKTYKAEPGSGRSPARVTVLIVGAVIVGVVAVVLVVSLLGSSSGKGAAGTSASTKPATSNHSHTSTSASTSPSESSTPSVSPAETQVAVLNGTTAEGLAHRLAASLQQSGYSQATALDGTPPGNHQTSVVEYTSGHHAEATQVAQALSISQVQPMEGSVSALVGSSTVVVIAGQDKAGSTGESSSSSSSSGIGESSSSSGGAESSSSGGTAEEAAQ
jgi:LytR cell envelope-related transcriptional attenuator